MGVVALALSTSDGGQESPRLAQALKDSAAHVAILDDAGHICAISSLLARVIAVEADLLIGTPASRCFNLPPDLLSAGGKGKAVVMCGRRGMPITVGVAVVPLPLPDRKGYRVCKFTFADLAAGVATADSRQERIQARGGDTVVAGHVQVIRLGDITGGRLPSSEKAAALACSIAKGVIANSLSPGDLFREGPEQSFVICFATKDVEHARTKAQLICGEIRERLLGQSDEAYEVLSQVDEIRIADGPAKTADDLLSEIGQRLSAARDQFRRRMSLTAADVINQARLELQPLVSRTLRPTTMVAAQLASESAHLLATMEGQEVIKDIVFQLDCLLLSLSVEHVYHSPAQETLVIVPVSYQTLDFPRYRSLFLDLLRGVEDAVRARIALEVHGVPDSIVDLQLERTLTHTASLVAKNIIRLPWSQPRINLRRHGISIASMQAFSAQGVKFSGKDNAHPLRQFANSLHKMGCALWVRDVHNTDAVSWFLAGGADFLHGAPWR